MHLWKECSMHERMWLIFLTVSYVLLYGFGQINLLTTATALMGSICMFLGAKAKIGNFYSGAIYTLNRPDFPRQFDASNSRHFHMLPVPNYHKHCGGVWEEPNKILQ